MSLAARFKGVEQGDSIVGKLNTRLLWVNEIVHEGLSILHKCFEFESSGC